MGNRRYVDRANAGTIDAGNCAVNRRTREYAPTIVGALFVLYVLASLAAIIAAGIL